MNNKKDTAYRLSVFKGQIKSRYINVLKRFGKDGRINQPFEAPFSEGRMNTCMQDTRHGTWSSAMVLA